MMFFDLFGYFGQGALHQIFVALSLFYPLSR